MACKKPHKDTDLIVMNLPIEHNFYIFEQLETLKINIKYRLDDNNNLIKE